MDDIKQEDTEEVKEEKIEEEPKKASKSKRDVRDEEIEKLKTRVEDLENQLKRAVADYRNQSTRMEEEKKEFVKFANKDLLNRLIPAFDTLFLAEKYVADEGIKLTVKHLQDALAEVGVKRVKTTGEIFNPEEMEVVTTDTGEENIVLDELRPGFVLNGKLLRPAHVKVGKS